MKDIFELFYNCSGVCTDTRQIAKDCMFIALKGANFNGNTFADKALELGAKYVVVDEQDFSEGDNKILVEDGLIFLQQLANYHRKKIGTKLIGITGSNGKTTSKELLNVVLSKKFKVLATEGNLNNHIGVPLTLLQLNKTHELGIIEMGANKPGDIKELCEIAEPNFGIITNIGKAHLEGFGGVEGVEKTKTELFRFLSLNRGVIFFNADDDKIVRNIPKNCPSTSYGSENTAELNGTLLSLQPEVEFMFSTNTYTSPSIKTKIIGKYNYYNFLLAAAVGNYFNVKTQDIISALSTYLPKNNRSQVEESTLGNTLILDAYNANPTSVESALDSFFMIERSNKLLILGDMLELGAEKEVEHKKVVSKVVKEGVSAIFVGELYYAQKTEAKQLLFFKSKDLAADYIKNKGYSTTLILLKGSRGIGLETLKNIL